MNKKASAYEVILNFFRLVFIIVVFSSVYFLVKVFIVQKTDVFEIESNLLAYRLLLSKDVNYNDEDINRLYVGIIDLQKFTSENFEKNILDSIYYGKVNSEASAKLILKDLESDNEYVKYYNKELYYEKKILVEAKLIGAGASKRLESTFYVLIKYKDDLKKGVLIIDAILPNR